MSLLLTVPGLHHEHPGVSAQGAGFQFFQSRDSRRVPDCCWFSCKNREDDILILHVVGSNCTSQGLALVSDFAEWMIKNSKFLSLVNIDFFKGTTSLNYYYKSSFSYQGCGGRRWNKVGDERGTLCFTSHNSLSVLEV